jgi:hypothetical protein
MSAIKPKPTIKKVATPSASGPSVLTPLKTQEKSKLTTPSNIIKTNDIQRPSANMTPKGKGISETVKKATATYSTPLQSKTPNTHPNATLQTPDINSKNEIQIREATHNESIQPIAQERSVKQTYNALQSGSFDKKQSPASEGDKIEVIILFQYFRLVI